MRHLAISLAAAGTLVGCESTRALTATPAATPWPAGAYLEVSVLLARQLSGPGSTVRPNTVVIKASDSLGVLDALPGTVATSSRLALQPGSTTATMSETVYVATGSTYALLAGGTALPLGAGLGFPRFPRPSPLPTVLDLVPVLATVVPNIAPLLPRPDGTQDLHFLVDQRVVRTFPATISVFP